MEKYYNIVDQVWKETLADHLRSSDVDSIVEIIFNPQVQQELEELNLFDNNDLRNFLITPLIRKKLIKAFEVKSGNYLKDLIDTKSSRENLAAFSTVESWEEGNKVPYKVFNLLFNKETEDKLQKYLNKINAERYDEIVFDPISREILAYIIKIFDDNKILTDQIVNQMIEDYLTEASSEILIGKYVEGSPYKGVDIFGDLGDYLLMNLARLLIEDSLALHVVKKGERRLITLGFFENPQGYSYIDSYLPEEYGFNQIKIYYQIHYRGQKYFIVYNYFQSTDEILAIILKSFEVLNFPSIQVEKGFTYSNIRFENTKISFDPEFYFSFYLPSEGDSDFYKYSTTIKGLNIEYYFNTLKILEFFKFFAVLLDLNLDNLIGLIREKDAPITNISMGKSSDVPKISYHYHYLKTQ